MRRFVAKNASAGGAVIPLERWQEDVSNDVHSGRPGAGIQVSAHFVKDPAPREKGRVVMCYADSSKSKTSMPIIPRRREDAIL